MIESEAGLCDHCGAAIAFYPCGDCGWAPTEDTAPTPAISDRVQLSRAAFEAWSRRLWNLHPHAKRHGIAPPFMTPLGSVNVFVRELEVRCSRAVSDSDGPGHTEVARLEMRRKSRRAEYAAYTRARLTSQPALEHVLRKFGVDGVYVYAELNANEIDVAYFDHFAGLGPGDIAEYTGRDRRVVDHLLERARWKLRRLAGGAAVSDQAAAG